MEFAHVFVSLGVYVLIVHRELGYFRRLKNLPSQIGCEMMGTFTGAPTISGKTW